LQRLSPPEASGPSNSSAAVNGNDQRDQHTANPQEPAKPSRRKPFPPGSACPSVDRSFPSYQVSVSHSPESKPFQAIPRSTPHFYDSPRQVISSPYNHKRTQTKHHHDHISRPGPRPQHTLSFLSAFCTTSPFPDFENYRGLFSTAPVYAVSLASAVNKLIPPLANPTWPPLSQPAAPPVQVIHLPV
jgi:hypothetical protein